MEISANPPYPGWVKQSYQYQRFPPRYRSDWFPPGVTKIGHQGHYLYPNAKGVIHLYGLGGVDLGLPDPGGHGSGFGGLVKAVSPLVVGAVAGNALILGAAAAGSSAPIFSAPTATATGAAITPVATTGAAAASPSLLAQATATAGAIAKAKAVKRLQKHFSNSPSVAANSGDSTANVTHSTQAAPAPKGGSKAATAATLLMSALAIYKLIR